MGTCSTTFSSPRQSVPIARPATAMPRHGAGSSAATGRPPRPARLLRMLSVIWPDDPDYLPSSDRATCAA